MAIVKIEPSGCCERHGLCQIRLAMYLEETDYAYERHYVYVPVLPEGGYPGLVDAKGNPLDKADYDGWLARLPHIWRVNSFHNHFLHLEPDVTDAEIMASAEHHLPNFYQAWCDDWGEVKGGMRHGWDVATRKRPKRYPKDAQRKVLVEARIEQIKGITSQISTDKLGGETFPATEIDVGPGADYGSGYQGTNETCVDSHNAANDTGALDYFELYYTSDAGNASDVKVGTFSGTAPDFTSRDSESIGTVTAGSKQTFSGKDCDVTTGDFIGEYHNDGGITNRSGVADGEAYKKAGDQFGAGQQTYSSIGAEKAIGIYGTGETPPTITMHELGQASCATAGM